MWHGQHEYGYEHAHDHGHDVGMRMGMGGYGARTRELERERERKRALAIELGPAWVWAWARVWMQVWALKCTLRVDRVGGGGGGGRLEGLGDLFELFLSNLFIVYVFICKWERGAIGVDVRRRRVQRRCAG